MSKIHWKAVFDDPAGALEVLRQEESEASLRLEEIREQVRLAETMAAAAQEWTAKFGPAPVDPAVPDPAGTEVSEPGPRRVRVMALLGQDPGRWWKVRDVAEALEIGNLKSLRVLLT